MKRFLCGIFALFLLSGCAGRELVNMESRLGEDYLAIIWEGRTYVPYCPISKGDRGAQIGFVDGDPDDRVFEYEGYAPEEWLIRALAHDGGAMLIKEITVTQIPDGLESEYEWNH